MVSFSLSKLVIRLAMIFFMSHQLSNANTLEVLTEDWAPFNYETDGKVVGYSSEVVRAVLAEAGIPFQIRLGVWKGIYRRALDQPNILIYTITRTKEREELFNWIGPIAERRQALYKLSSRKDIVVNKLEDAKQYRLVAQEQDAIALFLINNGFSSASPNFQLARKQVFGLKMLFADHVDLIPSHPLSMKYELNRQGYPEDQVMKVIDLNVEGAYYMAFSKGTNPDLIDRSRKAYEVLESSGKLRAIWRHYSTE